METGKIVMALMMCSVIGVLGFLAHEDEQRRERLYFHQTPEKVKASHDEYAATLCPDFLNGSIWEQTVSMRDRSWCEEYRDKIAWQKPSQVTYASKLPTGPAKVKW